MTKTELQKELLEKIKPGTKPSDLKKVKNVKPKSAKKDEGYESEEEKNIVPTVPTPPPLPNNQLALQKQIELHREIKKADEKIKKELQEKIKTLIKLAGEEKEEYKKLVKDLQVKIEAMNKTISDLKNQVKNPVEVKQELFTCYHCHQNQPLPLLVLELPEGKLCQPCWTILRKKTKESLKGQKPPTPQLFTCVVCEIEKTEIPIYKQVEISYKPNLIKGKEYPVCSTCSPHVKEYNENENRELEEWE